MARRKRKLKFAAPKPANTPGEGETRERFIDRMASRGNRDALDSYNHLREYWSHEEAAQIMRDEAAMDEAADA